MHTHRRSRGKALFEALCGFGLAASFAAASNQTGAPALMVSASIMGLGAIYWSFGIFGSDPTHQVEQPAAVVAVAPRADVEPPVPEEALALEQEVVAEPNPVAKTPRKPRVRKARKVAPDAAPAVEQAEPAAYADSAQQGFSLEPLFEPQPFARQPRAFGRKSRVRGPLSAA